MKKIYSILVILFSLVATSCTENVDVFNSLDTEDIEYETSLDSDFGDIDEFSSSIAFLDDENLTSRIFKDNLLCATTLVDFKKLDKTNPDTLTIDFGSGCTDVKGNIRKGKIIITYLGDRKINNTTTFDSFFLNGKQVNGTRTSTLVKLVPQTHEIKLEGGKVTWPDGAFATREYFYTRVRNLDLENSSTTIKKGSVAAGTNREGSEYSVQFVKDVIIRFDCAFVGGGPKFVPVSGIKVISLELANSKSKIVSVDFGNGECDKLATITFNGKTKEFELGKN